MPVGQASEPYFKLKLALTADLKGMRRETGLLAWDHRPDPKPGKARRTILQRNGNALPEPVMSVREAHDHLTAPGQWFEMEERITDGGRQRVWRNGPKTIPEILSNSRQFRDREFIVFNDERTTYDSFHRAVSTLAAQLMRDGLAKGDRVALAMRNLPEWLVIFFAASSVGAIVTPLNAWWTASELEFGLVDSGPKIAFLDAERFERFDADSTSPRMGMKVYVSRYKGDGLPPLVQRLEDVLGDVSDWANLREVEMPDVGIDPDDDATILYTSGTTGRPKGALSTHRSMTSATMTTAFAAARDFVRYGEPLPEADPRLLPQRVTLLVIPMFHVTGFAAMLLPLVNAGGKLVLMRKFDAEKAMELIENERVTATGGVPTIAWQIVEHPNRARFDLSSLKQVTYGGGLAPPELVRRLKAFLPHAKPGNGWGMTETSGTFASHLGRDYELRPNSCGPAAPTGDVEVRDPITGMVLPAGEAGEMWVRGPGVVRKYWNRPEDTAQTFVDGWLRTGDIARVDEEGFCYIVDRIKDIVIRGGENIYCAEVENHLHDHPAVAEVAVVGVPHRSLGEVPAAVVVVRAGMAVTKDELRTWAAQRLADYKIPTTFFLTDESLPKNPAGKIVKAPLRELFADQSEIR
jgi:long-chain acyl-CoA synthetase